MMQFLYTKGVTPEGYSVYMLSHSNWTVTKSTHYSNRIYGEDSIELIDEKSDSKKLRDHEFINDKTLRVTFTKDKNGSYIFLGVYELIKVDVITGIRTFRKKSDIYYSGFQI